MPTYDGHLDITVYGATKLEELAIRLKAAGDLSLRRRMLAALRKSAQEVRDAEKAAALELPAEKYEVGLRSAISDAITVRTSTTANRAGVRVMVNRSKLPETKKRLPVLMNRGRWRHPVFGNRENWVGQASKPRWWSNTAREHADSAQRRMLAVLDETAAQITGE